jgi:hypothetical protein
MVTRHSWQIPMPHNGARRWPLTDVRLLPSSPNASAAATLVPTATRKGRPLTVNSGMPGFSKKALWQVRLGRQWQGFIEQLCHQ